MLMSPKFKSVAAVNGVIEFNRAGIASKVVLPEEHIKRISYDVNVDAENNCVVFSGGDSVYIMTDRFAVLGGKDEEVDSNIFFIEGGIVIELLVGRIFLEGENGQVYSVNEVGDIGYPTPAARLNWIDVTDVYSNAVTVTKYKYSTTAEAAPKYVDNLSLNAQFHYVNTNSGYILKTKFSEFYGDLGLEKFQFINYAEAGTTEVDDGHVDIADLEDVEDEPEEDEFPAEGEDSFEGAF
jgi:hypothetical protein